MAKMKKLLPVLGRSELIDLPDLNLNGIGAKVDTGAYTSALHCTDIQLKLIEGREAICFKVFTKGSSKKSLKEYCFTDFSKKDIKNSFGNTETRYVIKTTVNILGEKFESEFSLADRENMRFPVLLGRKLLYRKFMVDVSKKNLSLKNNQRQP